MGIAAYGTLSIALLSVLWAFTIYNRLVRHRSLVAEAWSGIDAQLKRRADLIPNLVTAVQGYASRAGEAPGEVSYTPDWYDGPSYRELGTGGFATAIGAAIGTATAVAATPPGESSGSGGGSSGGGSSGGGGGSGW